MIKAYKVFTHWLCSPIQGGDPVWNGQLPYQLPKVEVDAGEAECGAGWNASPTPEDALVVAGLWPDGWPSRLFVVETDQPVVERGNKLRANSWVVTEEIADFRPAVERLTERFGVGDLASDLVGEQLAWREALVRPKLDQGQVEAGLRRALEARGLDWQLRLYAKAWDARAAWDAWDARDAWVAWDAWDARAAWAARDARAAWAIWAARVAWDARATRAAWDARDARDARAARAARAAWDAWAALVVWVGSDKGWVDCSRDYLTVGIRDAYKNGLMTALPVKEKMLGYVMVSESEGGER